MTVVTTLQAGPTCVERRRLSIETFSHRRTVSYIVATLDRPSLERTLASIELWPGDELLIARRTPPGGDWGHTERNETIALATGAWLAFIDDDDTYRPLTRARFDDAMRHVPGARDVPIMFRMQYPSGKTLWRDGYREVDNGNVGTPMMLVPNIPEMLHRFGHRFEGDFDFINGCRWPRRLVYWRDEIIVDLGHD